MTKESDRRSQSPYQMLMRWGAPGAIICILFSWIYMREDAMSTERLQFMETTQYMQDRFYDAQSEQIKSQEEMAEAIKDLAVAIAGLRRD